MIQSGRGTSFKSENAPVVQWKSYPTGETQMKTPYTYGLGCLRDIKLTSSPRFLYFSLICLISLQPVGVVEMVGWIKGGH